MSCICLIGDSHLAALKHAWNAIGAEFPGRTLVFFAGAGKSMNGLSVSDGALAPHNQWLTDALERTSGGESRIAGDYDRYVIHGMGLSVYLAIEVARKFRAEHHADDGRKPISDDRYAELVCRTARDTIAGRTLAKLREITAAPILVSPMPWAGAKNRRIRGTLMKAGESGDVARLFNEGCARLARASGAAFLPQPGETLEEDGIGTRAMFSAGPARFYAERANDDNSHMNAAYGEAVLRRVLMAAGLP
jgi:hypothetical protein